MICIQRLFLPLCALCSWNERALLFHLILALTIFLYLYPKLIWLYPISILSWIIIHPKHAYYLFKIGLPSLTAIEYLITSHWYFYLFQKCESLSLSTHSNFAKFRETVDIPHALAKFKYYHRLKHYTAQQSMPQVWLESAKLTKQLTSWLVSNLQASLSSKISLISMFYLDQIQLLSFLLCLVLCIQKLETIGHCIYAIIHKFSFRLLSKIQHSLLRMLSSFL